MNVLIKVMDVTCYYCGFRNWFDLLHFLCLSRTFERHLFFKSESNKWDFILLFPLFNHRGNFFLEVTFWNNFISDFFSEENIIKFRNLTLHTCFHFSFSNSIPSTTYSILFIVHTTQYFHFTFTINFHYFLLRIYPFNLCARFSHFLSPAFTAFTFSTFTGESWCTGKRKFSLDWECQ